MKASRFFLCAHPARALLEAWLWGLAILALVAAQVRFVSSFVLSNGVLFLCGVSGLWAVLRTRLPRGGWLRQAVWEFLVALALSLVMAVGITIPAELLGWQEVWLNSSLGTKVVAVLLLLDTGPGYLAARVAGLAAPAPPPDAVGHDPCPAQPGGSPGRRGVPGPFCPVALFPDRGPAPARRGRPAHLPRRAPAAHPLSRGGPDCCSDSAGPQDNPPPGGAGGGGQRPARRPV